jgi:tRNA (guanosine-2'-O-)-methyltransferase
MSIRSRIKQIKHLQNKYFICVLENPRDTYNIASAIRNISAFGVEKLYVIGNKQIVKDFETSRSNKHLNSLSVGANKWVFVKQFDTAELCIEHLKKNRYTIAVTSSHIKGQNNVYLYDQEIYPKTLSCLVWQ